MRSCGVLPSRTPRPYTTNMFERYLARGRGKLVAVIDIGSGSAAAGLIEVPVSGPAIVLRQRRIALPVAERSAQATIHGVTQAAEEAMRLVLKDARHGEHAPAAVYCIVRSPWMQTRPVRVSKRYDEPRQVTISFLRDLMSDTLKKQPAKRPVRHVGLTGLTLNGYPVSDPLKHTARQFSATVILGEIDHTVHATIVASLAKLFPHHQPHYRSSLEALMCARLDGDVAARDEFIIDVGAEATTFLSVRDGLIAGVHVIPQGTTALLRRVAPNDLPEHTIARLHLHEGGASDRAASAVFAETLAKVESELVRVFGEGMAACVEQAKLANSLTLIIRPELASWGTQFLSRIDFGQFTLTTQPFSVRTLPEANLASQAVAAPKAAADVSFLLSAALVNSELHTHGGEWYTLDAMAKEYFDDITPRDHSQGSMQRPTPPRPVPPPPPMPEEEEPQRVPIHQGPTEQRGIRTIAPSRAPRPSRFTGAPEAARTMFGGFRKQGQHSSRTRWWLWALAAFGVVAVGALVLIGLRPTTVTITPRSHTIQLTPATPYVAYPSTSAASGTLAYTTVSVDVDDSATVPASGTTNVPAAKASGSITIYNAYSKSPVNLVKDTRFETPDGLIFRAPAAVSVPGMSGTTPGSVTVTVAADQTGAKYNVGPVSKFTLPGLSGTDAMFKGVYAKSSASMAGGADASTGPGVDPATLNSTISQLRNSLASKALAALQAQAGDGAVILPGLVQVTYTDEPATASGDSSAVVHESAHASAPAFPAIAFGQAVGSAVSADAASAAIKLVPGTGFAAQYAGGAPSLGSDPVQFTLTGQADLIWQIDTTALTAALAGRDQGAFQTVISGFSGIQEAHAKIQPFWKSAFPSDPSAIKVVVTAPQSD